MAEKSDSKANGAKGEGEEMYRHNSFHVTCRIGDQL